jgi:hypothetical protein
MNNIVFCSWKFNQLDVIWETECQNILSLVDGRPRDLEMEYCPFCGKGLVEVDE